VPERGAAYVVGTFDTKGHELRYVAGLIREAGVPVVTVDVGTKSDASDVDVPAAEVAAHHPEGAFAVLGAGDRGVAVTAMTEALRRWIDARDDVGGMIGLAGSGGTAIVTPAMRTLPIGTPKLMVSTLAAGDMSAYVGIHDITTMFPVTDVAGLNRISRMVLGNAAHALAGMMLRRPPAVADDKPSLGLTMFGVTTPCVTAVAAALSGEYDCQVFHANGHGGRALEALVEPNSREKGYVNYDLHQGIEDPDQFFFYENWESDADLDAHLDAPHLRDFAARIPHLLDDSGLSVDRVRRIA